MKDFKQQALQVALYATWLAGFLFIALSLYATQLLSASVKEAKVNKEAKPLTVTIFTVPRPFLGISGERQSLAVHSWLRLSSHLQVVLLGLHPSLQTFAENFQPRVSVERHVDFTFSGAPLFHSIMARARASTSDIAVIIDPEFVLLLDFIDALEYVNSLEHDWLLIAIPRKLHQFPFHLEVPDAIWLGENSQPIQDDQVQDYVRDHSLWSNCSGKYVWAWNTGESPLHAGVMPPFVYGQGFHNEWLLNEALSSGIRFVFDASDAVLLFHPHCLRNSLHSCTDQHIKSKMLWEVESNTHLAALYGSFYFRPPNFLNTPAKLVRCGDSSLKLFRFMNPLLDLNISTVPGQVYPISWHNSAELQESSVQQAWNESFLTSFRRFRLTRRHTRFLRYPCYTSEVDAKRFTHFSLKKRLMIGRLKVNCHCSNQTEERQLDCPATKMKIMLKPATSLSMPLSLDMLLAKVSNQDNFVVVTVVGNNYRDMLMSWICRLRNLNILNFLVGAVDTEIYEFSLLQGLPVFKTGPSMNLSFNDCHFGTDCFQRVTKVKSRTVLQILELGYNVLFSDVDVYWFKDPIKYMMSFGPGTLAAQSDQWNETEPANEPRRLNSGFYLAWSDIATIAAFEKIVKHAAMTDMSEQPSFYDVLCGEFGRYRVGNSHCVEPETNVTVHFLDRLKFPNGAFHGLWETRNVSEACRQDGCFVLHNNWVSGRQRKLERQIASGLWDYDAKNRLCLRSWQGPKSSRAY